VSRYDPQQQTLSIDFVLHTDGGPASRWAASAERGDELGVAGPGGPNPLLAASESYLLAGDLSALPAISALLELMPADTRGQVLLEVPSAEDMLQLRAPEGVQVRWLFRAPRAPSALSREVRALSLSPQRTFAFIAGESSAVVAVRDHLLGERGFLRDQLYATPYWRETLSEEDYHDERHRIMDELATAPARGVES
jgi:NADPH-dependent ferric siderophore reductase